MERPEATSDLRTNLLTVAETDDKNEVDVVRMALGFCFCNTLDRRVLGHSCESGYLSGLGTGSGCLQPLDFSTCASPAGGTYGPPNAGSERNFAIFLPKQFFRFCWNGPWIPSTRVYDLVRSPGRSKSQPRNITHKTILTDFFVPSSLPINSRPSGLFSSWLLPFIADFPGLLVLCPGTLITILPGDASRAVSTYS